MELSDMVFIGFSQYVVALDRVSGELLWSWEAPKGKIYPAVLLDGDRLIVSMMGYTYCLDPLTGNQLWENELPGLGTGVASIATVRAHTDIRSAAAAAIAAEQAQRDQQMHSAHNPHIHHHGT